MKYTGFLIIVFFLSLFSSMLFGQDGSVPVGNFHDMRKVILIRKDAGSGSGFGRAVQYYTVTKHDVNQPRDGDEFQSEEPSKKKKTLSFQERGRLLRKGSRMPTFNLTNY